MKASKESIKTHIVEQMNSLILSVSQCPSVNERTRIATRNDSRLTTPKATAESIRNRMETAVETKLMEPMEHILENEEQFKISIESLFTKLLKHTHFTYRIGAKVVGNPPSAPDPVPHLYIHRQIGETPPRSRFRTTNPGPTKANP